MKKHNWDKQELNKLYHLEGKTLEEVGTIYGVTRERIRQVMRNLGLPSGHNRSKKTWDNYSSLEDYLVSYTGKRDYSYALNKYSDNLFCSECGRSNNDSKRLILHIHHIVYPATSLNDIQVLCASCHIAKHRKGITFAKQLDIFNLHRNGVTAIKLATKYNVSRNLIHKIIAKIRNGDKAIKR